MNTTASAQGNAAAILNVIASSPPETCPFEFVLTEEMELLHFINNEDVMEHAEEMEEALNSIERATERLAQLGSRHRHRGVLRASIRRNRERIPELEALILAEIDEAQNEYRMLAHALCEGRENYVEARAEIGDAPVTQGQQRRINRTGRDNSRPELNGRNMHVVLNYERTHHSYKIAGSGVCTCDNARADQQSLVGNW